MLVLRYRHRLPADYDMARIRRRVAERGSFFDATPGLGFKAFSIAEGAGGNVYAATYLWLDPLAAGEFLTDHRFRAVVDGFGRPRVETWLPLVVAAGSGTGATVLVRETLPVSETRDLAALRAAEAERAASAVAEGACAAVSALDPGAWRLLRLTLRRDGAAGTPHESVLHLAAPGWARLSHP
ncbi:DUF4865 family protein [Methylobacterium gregans]|uniref:DUF4865 family protein n=1 Tax=Methylobacterium gregans TaxID=374424 RepID=A0AA37MA90_9HYPH|nr:DUF4865 family protein [Methylobacterium gregans]MDQ0521437.1 hypothetical protein [Methylobacterium gregans]GJD78107.1 hypothetical protein NBEOAGPD_1319 [Methylobacterium gregans]GLS54601.1 hypothetical protein GCM10007886_27840 [Methylobacterium gregans]